MAVRRLSSFGLNNLSESISNMSCASLGCQSEVDDVSRVNDQNLASNIGLDINDDTANEIGTTEQIINELTESLSKTNKRVDKLKNNLNEVKKEFHIFKNSISRKVIQLVEQGNQVSNYVNLVLFFITIVYE
jgi:uncharacterized protein (DUF342 family)